VHNNIDSKNSLCLFGGRYCVNHSHPDIVTHQILAPIAFSDVSRYMLNVTPLLDSSREEFLYPCVAEFSPYHMKSHSWIAVSTFVLIMLPLSLAILVFQYTTFDVLLFPIKEAKAIKHKTSSSASPPSSNEGNTVPISPSQSMCTLDYTLLVSYDY
jgi:hypothetical protein